MQEFLKTNNLVGPNGSFTPLTVANLRPPVRLLKQTATRSLLRRGMRKIQYPMVFPHRYHYP